MKLDAKNVSVSIAGKPIVRNLSIEVPDRKFSALLGANGSGKTTLLRSIYRTQKLDSGNAQGFLFHKGSSFCGVLPRFCYRY